MTRRPRDEQRSTPHRAPSGSSAGPCAPAGGAGGVRAERGGGELWIVGYHPVVAALEVEPRRVEVVLVGEGVGGSRAREVLARARAAGVRFRSVPRAELDAVARGVAHNGFAARVAPHPLVEATGLLQVPAPACLVGLDGVEDGHNLGAVIRLAAGLGLAGVIVAGPHPPPLGGAAAKVAAGTLPLVPVSHVGSLGDFAVRAKEAGFWVVGADPSGSAVTSWEFPDRLLLCLGAEAGGLRAKTRRALDLVVGIPLAPGVESLNLSVAAAVLAWEWRRRYPLGTP